MTRVLVLGLDSADAELMQRLGGHVGAALALERETAQRVS